jgi:NtrC-family two-component system sensor histidine kinase KinB
VTAKEDSDRLHGILSDLLDISRIKSGNATLEFRTAPPRTVVLDAIEPYRRAAQDQGVELVLELKDDLPDVWVDLTRIGHVFGNLISNALKFTPPGGRIAVGAAAEEAFVCFSVSDTGTGIPEEFLSRVFEPFFRVPGRGKEIGAGLGLAIVKEIVEAHGGTVGAANGPGTGSTFTFTLQRADRRLGGEIRA